MVVSLYLNQTAFNPGSAVCVTWSKMLILCITCHSAIKLKKRVTHSFATRIIANACQGNSIQ